MSSVYTVFELKKIALTPCHLFEHNCKWKALLIIPIIIFSKQSKQVPLLIFVLMKPLGFAHLAFQAQKAVWDLHSGFVQ